MTEESHSGFPQIKQLKSLWGGIGRAWTSVKKKTLDIVDNIQDKITELDQDLEAKPLPPPRKLFDRTVLPILENASTYIDEPMSSGFSAFSESFVLEDHREDILLFSDNSPNLRRIYSRLVPSVLTEEVFWCRLFYKIDQRESAKKMSKELQEHLKTEETKEEDTSNLGLDLTPEELAELEKMENMNSDGSWGEWE